MPADWVYHLSGVLLLLGNVAAWVATFFMLPGNWVMFGLMLLAAWLLPETDTRALGVGWWEAFLFGVLAALGELLEFATGAATAKQAGASRRAMVLALVGAILGSLVGGTVGTAIPIPVVGTLAGVLAGAGLGAFAGAYLGEAWKGRTHNDRLAIGTAALAGRMLGTVAKLVIGIVMVVATAVVYWAM